MDDDDDGGGGVILTCASVPKGLESLDLSALCPQYEILGILVFQKSTYHLFTNVSSAASHVLRGHVPMGGSRNLPNGIIAVIEQPAGSTQNTI